MKKVLFTVLSLLLLISSCSYDLDFEMQEDGTIALDDRTFYPLESSYRFTDYGKGRKQGEVGDSEVYVIDGEETVLLVKSEDSYTYYVDERLRDFNKLFEECTEYFFVPEKDLDRNGRVDRKYAEKAKRLTGEDAVDFSFYVFYGRPPQELGYKKGEYAGEIYGEFDEISSLASSYPVYKYSKMAYSVVIDGTEYLMEIDLAKKIGIITE